MLRLMERFLFLGALVAISVFAYAYGQPKLQASQSVSAFSEAKSQVAETLNSDSLVAEPLVADTPDTTLWSSKRVEAYTAAEDSNPAIGILTIDRLAIEAPVYAGTSDHILDQGVGWVEGTASLDEEGNVGLAAHRDGFFRGLKNIGLGDTIEVSTLTGQHTYRVTGTDIINPDDTYVLEPTNASALTLITCYPFYYVGSAPNRFVVFATKVTDQVANKPGALSQSHSAAQE